MNALSAPRRVVGNTSPQQVRRSVLLIGSTLLAGGTERVICELANAWVKCSWRVGVMTMSSAEPDHYTLNSEVARIGLDLIWDSRSLLDSVSSNLRRNRILRQQISLFCPDVVLSFIEQTNVRVLGALLFTPVPVIVSERTDPRRYPIGTAWKLGRRLLYRRANAVVVQTETVGAWARSFLPDRNVKVVPNFVRDLPLPCTARDPRLILAVGRLERVKGFDLLLDAFAASGVAERGFKLVILGEGSERRALMEQTCKLAIEAQVSMPGVVRDPDSWMARAAIFVLTSRYEGFPNALLEAMAMGCAVVATDCDSGPRDIVRNEVDGLLVPAENKAALTAQLLRLTIDPALQARLASAAISVRERFSKPRVIRQWEELIEESCTG